MIYRNVRVQGNDANDIIISSYSMGIFLMYFENVTEILALLFSSLTEAFRMYGMYLLKLYNWEPLCFWLPIKSRRR